MRDGKLFVRDDVGYRAGIHMKEYQNKRPYLVVGGTAGDFLGEYMAGGVILILGLNVGEEKKHQARFIGTGMHGGVIYMRGKVNHLGKEAEISDVNEEDMCLINDLTCDFCKHFGFDFENIMKDNFKKITPLSQRPYGNLYAY